MQTKKENCLIQTSVTFNEEENMKDYKLDQLNDVYGNLMEEILCEVFSIEDQEDSLNYVHEGAIYDLRSDDELEIQKERELRLLNEDCAEVESINELEEQALSYFSNPYRAYYPKEEESPSLVTGYIQLNSGIRFDEKGCQIEIWRSFGQKLTIDFERLYDPESILTQIRTLGFETTELLRVVFYGPALSELVGTRDYSKGEKKSLEILEEDYPMILLAIQDKELRDLLFRYDGLKQFWRLYSL